MNRWIPLFAAIVLLPTSALAGNGTHPRTPVLWSDAPCMTIIDRSVNPIHSFTYSIPMEDTDVTPDEVVDSRTHQFFGWCRDHHLEEILPGWITEANAMDAGTAGLGNFAEVDLETDILENNLEWADCWTRITQDDERRPITFAAAAEPVEWDTTALAAGTWVVEGYTYEPWFNIWSGHPGVFKIVDDPDPAASPPAAALTFAEQGVVFGETGTVTGCVDAMSGSTMTFYWAISAPGDELVWNEFASVPVEGSGFELAYEPSMETISNTVMIKVEVEDPMARSWTAHAIEYFAVTEDVGDDGCEEGGFVSDPCDTGTDNESEGGTETSAGEGESGPTATDAGGESGCGCRSTSDSPASTGFGLATIGLLGLQLRRRRRLASPNNASPNSAAGARGFEATEHEPPSR